MICGHCLWLASRAHPHVDLPINGSRWFASAVLLEFNSLFNPWLPCVDLPESSECAVIETDQNAIFVFWTALPQNGDASHQLVDATWSLDSWGSVTRHSAGKSVWKSLPIDRDFVVLLIRKGRRWNGGETWPSRIRIILCWQRDRSCKRLQNIINTFSHAAVRLFQRPLLLLLLPRQLCQ